MELIEEIAFFQPQIFSEDVFSELARSKIFGLHTLTTPKLATAIHCGLKHNKKSVWWKNPTSILRSL
ncbi:MAG: hypothetical protein OXN83_04300 [Oligoflexia bacterium]|nr:hypothetical protein [Oligoflexia bacterium]